MDVSIKCPCPPRADGEPRHDADTVTLRDKLDFHATTSIRKQIGIVKMDDPDTSTGEILAVMTEHYLLFGIEAWTITDAKGHAIEVDRAAIRAFLERVPPDTEMDLTDAADELYSARVLRPLVARGQSSSPPSPMAGSTSAKRSSGTTRPRQPKRSSTSTSRTDGTGTITTLPVGGSSSSQSLATAR